MKAALLVIDMQKDNFVFFVTGNHCRLCLGSELIDYPDFKLKSIRFTATYENAAGDAAEVIIPPSTDTTVLQKDTGGQR